jgi:hypothetical protein
LGILEVLDILGFEGRKLREKGREYKGYFVIGLKFSLF